MNKYALFILLSMFPSLAIAQETRPNIKRGNGEDPTASQWAERSGNRSGPPEGFVSRLNLSNSGGHDDDSLAVGNRQLGVGYNSKIAGLSVGFDAGFGRRQFHQEVEDIDLSIFSTRIRAQASFQFSRTFGMIVGPTFNSIDSSEKDSQYFIGGFAMLSMRFGRAFNLSIGLQASFDTESGEASIRPQFRLNWQISDDWKLQVMRDLRLTWQFEADWSASLIGGLQGNFLSGGGDFAKERGYDYSETHTGLAFRYTFWQRSSIELGLGAVFNQQLQIFDDAGNETAQVSESITPRVSISLSIFF